MTADTLGVHTAIDAAIAHYGEGAIGALLNLAPLFAQLAARGALIAAQRSYLADVDGTLIIRVPGLPGVPPMVTWTSGDQPLAVLAQRPLSGEGK